MFERFEFLSRKNDEHERKKQGTVEAQRGEE